MTGASKNVEHNLHRETRSAASFLDSMREALEGDDELLTDMLEGETGLIEALEKAANSIDEENILIDGMAKRIEELQERKRLSEARVSRIRALIEQAILVANEGRTFRLPTMTLTLLDTPQSALISDESIIPAAYWTQPKPPAPKLDKKKLAEDLKAGTAIPGCELDNGGVSLTIRRK